MKNFLICIFILLCCSGVGFAAAAAPGGDTSPTCPDNELLSGKLITDISWGAMFPLRISGVPIGGGEVPSGAADARPVCFCLDNNNVPELGTQFSMYEPARVVDVTRTPWCSLSLGGVRLRDGSRSVGKIGQTSNDNGDTAFYHYTYYAFPLLSMMELFIEASCSKDNYSDFDLMYTSPIDPTHNDDELAFMLSPESAWVSNPIAMSLQIPDCIAASAGMINDKWFWTAGCWGNLYPLTGNIVHESSPPRDTNLIATRALATLHRRGLARITMGEEAMCKGPFYPFIPKSQYRWATFYPLPEVSSTERFADLGGGQRALQVEGHHVIGASTFLWGEWRNIPAIGEDFTYMLWRWNDCCMR